MLVLAFGATILPRVTYYLERANFHAALERSRNAKVRGDQSEADGRSSIPDDYLSYPTQEVEKVLDGEGDFASFHARLREQYRRAAYRFWERPPVDLPLPYPWDRDRDRRVLEAVVLQIIQRPTTSDTTDPDRHSPPDSTVIVDDKNTIGSFEESYDPDLLPGRVTTHAAADLARRNGEGPVPLAELKFRSRQIVIDDLNRLGWDAFRKYPDGVAFVRVSLPGYSRDGKIALVAVSIAFDQHGSGENFALVLSNGEWRVAGSYLSIKE